MLLPHLLTPVIIKANESKMVTFSSLETRVLTQGNAISFQSPSTVAQSGGPLEKALSIGSQSGLGNILPSAGAPQGISAPNLEQPLREKPADYDSVKKEFSAKELLFYPANSSECVVMIGSQVFRRTPKNNCVVFEGSVTKRIFCPLVVLVEQVSQHGSLEIVASGSCNERATVFVGEEFRVDAIEN